MYKEAVFRAPHTFGVGTYYFLVGAHIVSPRVRTGETIGDTYKPSPLYRRTVPNCHHCTAFRSLPLRGRWQKSLIFDGGREIMRHRLRKNDPTWFGFAKSSSPYAGEASSAVRIYQICHRGSHCEPACAHLEVAPNHRKYIQTHHLCVDLRCKTILLRKLN